MNILVIGGLGFIGSHLSELLVNYGHKVTILSRSKDKIQNIDSFADKIQLVIKDVKDIGSLVAEFDVIFYLAGTTDNYALIDNDLDRDIDANCRATLYLLDACQKYNRTVKIIFGSTFFVVGIPETLPVAEDAKTKPLALYPATKLCAEHFCYIFHNVYGLNIVIARFTNVFGPREKYHDKRKAAFNYMIFTALQNGELTLYETGDFVRDYIYVTDVAFALVTLMEKGSVNEVYFVGRGEGILMKRLFEMIVELTGSGRIVNISTPKFHTQVGIRDFYCDNDKIKALGWLPKTSIAEGIRQTAEYYKRYL